MTKLRLTTPAYSRGHLTCYRSKTMQPSPFDQRTHPLYGRTRLYGLNLRDFSEITISPPSHIFYGCLHFHLGTTIPSQSVGSQDTPYTPYIYGQDTMALSYRNYHYFHCITAPTHILGMPPLSLRNNKSNPVRSTTGHTSNMDGLYSMALWL